MKYLLSLHRENAVAIEECKVPDDSSEEFHSFDEEQGYKIFNRTKWNEALSSALEQHGVRVENAKLDDDSDLYVTPSGRIVVHSMKSGELYPVPEGWEVKILYFFTDSAGKEHKTNPYYFNGAINFGRRKAATLVPSSPKEPTPFVDLMKSERSWPEDFDHENGKYLNKCGVKTPHWKL